MLSTGPTNPFRKEIPNVPNFGDSFAGILELANEDFSHTSKFQKVIPAVGLVILEATTPTTHRGDGDAKFQKVIPEFGFGRPVATTPMTHRDDGGAHYVQTVKVAESNSFKKVIPEFMTGGASHEVVIQKFEPTDGTSRKKVIPKLEPFTEWAMTAAAGTSLKAPAGTPSSRRSHQMIELGGLRKKKRGIEELASNSVGYEGMIDGEKVSWTRQAPKMSETSLREIGPKTLYVLEGAEQHSLKQTERLKAVRAAVWLESKVRSFSWTRKSGLNKAVAFDRKIASLAMNGAIILDNMRCILASFIKWSEDNADIIEGDCLEEPIAVDVIAEYVADMLAGSRGPNGKGACGSAGQRVIKMLALAHSVVNAPFPPELLKMRSVTLAATSPSRRPLPRRAATSIALVCQIEDLALGPTHWDAARPGVPYCGAGDVVVQSARSLLIAAHSSARGVSVRRMKSMGMCRPADGSTPYLVLESTGDKGPSTAAMVATEHRILAEGFTPGLEKWLPDFAAKWKGKAFVVEGVTCPQGDYSNITGTTAKVASAADITGLVRLMATFAPIRQTVDASKQLRLTGHGLRHLHPTIAKVLEISLDDRYGIGKWRKSKAMPDQYAGDDFDNDLEVRKKVIRAVRSYIGTRPWDQCVPLQSNEKPSVLFMKQTSGR